MHPTVNTLVSAYRDRVQPRMASLPMFNPALRVEAVGFQSHDGRLCGVLITPWFMNLVLLPGENEDWATLAPGQALEVSFPAGNYQCMISTLEGFGSHLSLPLFTTVKDFPDQDTALRVARDILCRLYQTSSDPAHNDATVTRPGKSGWPWPLSRRELLLGRSDPEEAEK